MFLIALGAFYPIVINTTQGARGIDKNWIRAALMMGAKPMDVLTRVVLPASLPSIFTGLRVGLGIGWTAVIVSEMIAVKSGLGYVLGMPITSDAWMSSSPTWRRSVCWAFSATG